MGSELRWAGPVCADPESWYSHSRATDCSTWFLKQLVVSNCSFPGVEVAMIVSSFQEALERTHARPAIQSILDRFGCGLVAVAMESSMDFEGEAKVSRPAIPVKIHRLPFCNECLTEKLGCFPVSQNSSRGCSTQPYPAISWRSTRCAAAMSAASVRASVMSFSMSSPPSVTRPSLAWNFLPSTVSPPLPEDGCDAFGCPLVFSKWSSKALRKSCDDLRLRRLARRPDQLLFRVLEIFERFEIQIA